MKTKNVWLGAVIGLATVAAVTLGGCAAREGDGGEDGDETAQTAQTSEALTAGYTCTIAKYCNTKASAVYTCRPTTPSCGGSFNTPCQPLRGNPYTIHGC